MNRVAFRFEQNLQGLDRIFSRAQNLTNDKLKQIALSSVVVRLHDMWNIRCRQIVLESLNGTDRQKLDFLRSNWAMKKKMDKSWEPDWHIPANTIRAARILNNPHYLNIQNALGAVILVDDIRWTRNAIVHSVPIAYYQYRKMALQKYQIKKVLPHELPVMINPLTSNSIYEDWCTEMLNALAAAI